MSQVILDESSSSWTATEVDPEAVADLTLIQAATPIVVGEPEPTKRSRLAALAGIGTARLLVQAAVVIGAALLVGVVVFVAVRSLASGDDGGSALDEDPVNPPLIEPGPSVQQSSVPDAGGSSDSRSSSGDRNSSDTLRSAGTNGAPESDGADDGGEGDRPTTTALAPLAPTTAAGADDADPEENGDDPGNTPGVSTSDGDSATTSTVGQSTTSASTSPTSNPATTVPTSVGSSSTAPTTGTSATTTSRPSTTASTTPTTKPTTASTPPPTTADTVPPLPDALIAAPANGSVQSWNTVTKFRANEVPGAVSYCWTIVAGERANHCGDSRAYDLPAGALSPGSASVKAEAVGSGGRVIMTERIDISLLATKIIDDPEDGERFDRNDRIRLRSEDVPTADNYCWVLSNDEVSSGEFCDSDGRVTLPPAGSIRRSLGSGEVKIQARAYRGSTLIGRQTIHIHID